MRETCVGMEGTKFGKKRDPLQYCRVLGKGALEPAKSFLFFAKRDVNRGDHRRRDISLLPGLEKLSKSISRLHLPAHPDVGNRKAATREMRRILRFRVESDCFVEVSFLAIRSGKSRIQIKVIWIELERPLALTNCVVDLVVGEVGSSGNITCDRRHRI